MAIRRSPRRRRAALFSRRWCATSSGSRASSRTGRTARGSIIIAPSGTAETSSKWRSRKMKITDVEAIHLRLPQVEEIADGTQDVLVIRIHTDAGLVGIGEVSSQSYVCKAIFEAP